MTPAVFTESMEARLCELSATFRVPALAATLLRRLNEAGLSDALPVVLEALEGEQQARHQRRVDRLRRASQLPPSKTFATLQEGRLPRPLMAKLRELSRGTFLDRASNVLAFGQPGVGKSHAVAALGHALVERGRSVLWMPAFRLVQELLAAKRDLRLPQALRRYDNVEVLILDDIGYIQQNPEEAEVLFTLMSERYERRSLILSSNLVFSEWDRIFKNPMTTLAAIDRLVHHAVILEFSPMKSFREEEAQKRQSKSRLRQDPTPAGQEATEDPREATQQPEAVGSQTAPRGEPESDGQISDNHDNYDNHPPQNKAGTPT